MNEDVFPIEPIEDQVRLVSEDTRALAQFVPFARCARMLGQEREQMFEAGVVAFRLSIPKLAAPTRKI